LEGYGFTTKLCPQEPFQILRSNLERSLNAESKSIKGLRLDLKLCICKVTYDHRFINRRKTRNIRKARLENSLYRTISNLKQPAAFLQLFSARFWIKLFRMTGFPLQRFCKACG
jgi:hypothetical protein